MSANRFKLSVMMFLEFFIWGAWFPLIFGYLPSLGFDAWQQGWILGAFNLAAFAAMFFSTQFADRNFSAERFLAFSQLVGGAAIMALFWIRKPEGADSAPFWPFFALMLVHSLFYVPTISITNAIAFANLKDPQKEFGPVRLWGTIGWIAAAWPFVFILLDWANVPSMGEVGFVDWWGEALGAKLEGTDYRSRTASMFVVAGVASLLLAAFSLSLPHTPPKPAPVGGESLAWLEAVKLLKKPFILVLFLVTFIDAAVHQYFFAWAERYLTGGHPDYPGSGVRIPSNFGTAVMSIGQVAEIVTMAFLGYV